MSSAAARYAGVVLAAGGSRRFAGPLPKQLVELDGEPLVRRAARTALASRLDEVIVVVGFRAPEVRRALAGLEVSVVENRDWSEGQSSSVRAGLAAVGGAAAGVLFIPCDQPFLTAELLDRLIVAHAEAAGASVVPAAAGRRGAPVLVDRSLFAELARIRGDEGARQLFAGRSVRELELDGDLPLRDFDSRQELAALLAAGTGR